MELIGLAGASLSLIVGSVYSAFLSKVTRDYLSGPVDYSKLLTSISHAGDAIAGYYRIRDDKELREAMIDFKSILQHLAFYSYRLFAPTNIDRLGDTAERPSIPAGLLARESIAETISAQNTIYKVTNIPPELAEVNRDALMGADAIHLIRKIRVYYYSRMGKMRAEISEIELIEQGMKPLRDVWKVLEQIESMAGIHEPEVFQMHMQALFVFYFFLWIPVSAWASVGWLASIIVYPFIAIAFLGPGIYNMWIGNPFDPSSPVLIVDFIAKREQYAVNNFEALFDLK